MAQRREAGVTIKQIAEDFGISETCLQNWLRQAEIDAGSRPGTTAADGIPVTVTCRVLKLARQPYYRWLANPVSDSELVEVYRANALFDAH